MKNIINCENKERHGLVRVSGNISEVIIKGFYHDNLFEIQSNVVSIDGERKIIYKVIFYDNNNRKVKMDESFSELISFVASIGL